MSMSPQIGWSVLVNIGPNLLQEGLVGAFRAAQQWDPDAASSWSTWARNGVRMWIRQHLRQGCTEIAHQPETVREKRWAVGRAQEELRRQGKPDDIRSAALYAGVDPDLAQRAVFAGVVVHLDAPEAEVLRGEDADLDERVDDILRMERLAAAIGRLSLRERAVMLARGAGETLAEIGARLGVSRERARQIEANAFRAVRADLGIEVAVDEAAAPLAGRVHSWLLGQRRPVGTRDVADGVGVPIGSAHRALRAVAQRVGMANGLHVLWEARP